MVACPLKALQKLAIKAEASQNKPREIREEATMISYQFNQSEKRAVALDESGNEVGECTLTTYPSYWSIDHTYINPKKRGQGIAEGLVQTVVSAAKEAEVKLKPVCSYAVKAFQEKPEYQAFAYQ
ncbi:MAG: GNAT family N-acetyltransferase [Anaerolineaceae bacterium]|nr:GNAT family N-acetyltransferase [Anaerolineaceae bacterium]